MAKNQTRTIDVLLFDGVNLLDVAGPVQAFTTANGSYKIRFVSADGDSVRACCGLMLGVDGVLDCGSAAADLLVPGGGGVDGCLADPRVLAIIGAWLAGRADGRLISICSGALILAASGVLDGRVATTHWSRAASANEGYSAVDWQLDRIYVMGEQIFTSAGVTTGIDMALSIIRRDCGPAIALAVGRELVVQMQRSGGQQQFSTALAAQQSGDSSLSKLAEMIAADVGREWTLETMAGVANIGLRSLTRKFNQQTGMSPAKFVERMRVDHARDALMHGDNLKRVAASSGFGDAQRMRRAFMRHLGISAAEYAANFAVSEADDQ